MERMKKNIQRKEPYKTPMVEVLEVRTEGIVCVSKPGYEEEDF